MKMCPECSLELPDGIPQCPDCEVPMIDPDELFDEMEPHPMGQRFVLLRTFPSRLYATMLKEALQHEGIPSILQSEDVGVMLGNYGTAPFFPVRVLVPATRRSVASRIAEHIAGSI
jgi:hypothetical protein